MDAWVEGFDFPLVCFEMRAAEVADVDCFCAVVCELVGACSADSGGRVCACILVLDWLVLLGWVRRYIRYRGRRTSDDDDFVFYSAEMGD